MRKPFYIRDVDEQTIRDIKVIAAEKGMPIGKVMTEIVNGFKSKKTRK